MPKKRILFTEITPLGHRVILTRDRWKEIVRFKHPALAEHVNDVRRCLREPEVIRESIKDSDTHLYYCPVERGFVCVVVGGPIPDQRFVITAYFTKELKKGTDLWTK